MDEDGDKRHRFKRSSSVDRISSLPDCLLSQILSNLPTKDSVKTSVLSKRWRNLWKRVPALDLANLDFPDLNTLSTFVDSFLDFNSFLHKFKLNYGFGGEDDPEKKTDLITRWINAAVVTRKVKHVQIVDDADGNWELEMPTTLYTCETLVSLNLSGVILPSVNFNFFSLPCLKAIDLNSVVFDDGLALEWLISSCRVLESLGVEKSFCADAEVLRVRSESLLRFTHFAECDDELVEIDAPRLEYLRIIDHRVESLVLKNVASLVDVDIDSLSMGKELDPNDVQKRNMIRGFLVGISRVKDLIIASSTLEVIFDYSRCEPLPLFRNLTFLRVEFYGYMWEMLPVFLQSCPNLKSLVVGSTVYRENYGVHTLFQPQRFLSCLEYVKIERPLEGEAVEMKLVSYLLGNSTILKKLTLFLDVSIKREESAVLKELLTIPRLSSSCQVVVL